MKGIKLSLCGGLLLLLLWAFIRLLLGPLGAVVSLNYRAFAAVALLGLLVVFSVLTARVVRD